MGRSDAPQVHVGRSALSVSSKGTRELHDDNSIDQTATAPKL